MWRVLVVEDDALQAEHVCDLLVEEGMEPVGPAPTSEAALSLLDTVSVDAAILDVRLRSGLCFEIARTLMARRVPFLFLTGSLREVLPTEFRSVPLLQKPCEPGALFNMLRTMLPSQGDGW
jgi:DNA-binding response OmpR family regulator